MTHGGDIYRNKVNIDFSVNLNPLGTPERVKAETLRSIGRASLYPDITQEEARSVIASSLGVDSSCVYAGSGASELITALVRAVAPKKALLFEPAFSGYEHALKAAGCDIVMTMLDEKDGFAMSGRGRDAMDECCDILFLCDPSNPSGRCIDEEILRELLEDANKRGIYVCLDESFYLMSDRVACEDFRKRDRLTEKYGNLMIVRSLTKVLAMPGIRMGYVLASPDLIEKISGQLPEWNLSVCSEAGIKAGIKEIYETDFIERTMEMVIRERKTLTENLKELGFKVYDSDTSFLLFKGPVDLYDKLLERGILIRDCRDYAGLGEGFYRIAVRSQKDNEKLCEELRRVTEC